MGNCHIVGPNEVMVVSGGCCSNTKRIIIGGCAWAWWGVSNVQKMNLNVMTLLPKCENVETKQGVSLTVTGVAQVMVMAEDHMAEHRSAEQQQQRDAFLHKALEQFLGKTEREIRETILQTLEGHLRAILGTLTVEEIYKEREMFAKQVRDVASPDVAKMGLEILSFTIKDVSDRHMYLDSLGKAQIARVTRDADIGKAETSRDSGIREAECERERMQTKFDADSTIANAEREFKLTQAGYQQEVNQRKAEAELAYTLAASKLKQEIRREEVEIEVVERRRQIEVEEKEVLRKEKELVATVHRPAEAERYQVEVLAQANRTLKVAQAQGEAERIKAVGAAQAAVIQAKGEAEAASMSARASAYKAYGDAAILSLVLDSLPVIAGKVAAPLAAVKEVVVLPASGESSTDDILSTVTKLAGSLPPAVQALTGINIGEAVKEALRPKQPAAGAASK